jgi:hypothetical protein
LAKHAAGLASFADAFAWFAELSAKHAERFAKLAACLASFADAFAWFAELCA